MLKISISKSEKKDRQELYRKCPEEQHADQLISEDCEIWVDGVKVLTYLKHFPMEDLRAAVRAVDNISVSRRQSGVPSQSRVFGFSPRMPVQQRDYCASATLNREFPASKDVLFYYAQVFTHLLETHHPERLAVSRAALEKVKPEWIIPGSVFTSGIINQDNPLQYHYDGGNFEGTWSAMAVFKEQTTGGHLALPEFGVKLACQDSSILIFDGQSELHGVTPIRKMSADAYRFSIVFYSLAQLCKCGTPSEELRRAQVQRTQVEMKRAGIKK